MYIIIEWIGLDDNIRIVEKEGLPIIFGSEHTAQRYAEQYCKNNWKTVSLD